jgi:hypothetical protein
MAVGLSNWLLCPVQPFSMLVRDHLRRRDFEIRLILASFETSKVDAIVLQILQTPGKAELRSGAVRAFAAPPWCGRRQGYPS